jgi:AraC-like DNA-binding protein
MFDERLSYYADYAPPKGHPLCWLFRAAPFELAYLSWGNRWYGDAPANPTAHDGWHYFVALEGAPELSINGRCLMRTTRGTAVICDPDCIVGHFDDPGRRCQMLTWVWRTPPAHSALRPVPEGFIKFALDSAVLRQLKKLHETCRKAVAQDTESNLLQLRTARLQLDLLMLEGREERPATDRDFRINLATEFLRQHLNEPEPVKQLCEHLHVSEASLKRLFHEHTGMSPRAFVSEWRMQWAHEQLAGAKHSVKAVAYALGYRHANDFSRAFKRHYGLAATRLLARRAG